MIRIPVLKHLPEAREEGAKEMSEERSDCQRSYCSPRDQKYLLSYSGDDGSYNPPK